MPVTQPNPTDLVEVQEKQIEDLSERLGILNEVVAKRQEEADTLRNQVVTTQAQISSARRQWERDQLHQQEQFQAWQQMQEEALALKQRDLSTSYRQVQESIQQTNQLKEETRLQFIDLQREREQFRSLSQDRLDTAKLKLQAELSMREAQTLFGEAQHAKNQANQEMTDVKTILAQCEERNQQMQAAWNKITAKEEDLRLRERDIEIREQAVKHQLAEQKSESVEPAVA